MPRFRLFDSSAAVKKVAADVMTTEVPALLVTSRFADVAKLLSASSDPTLPLVDTTGMFMGVVKRRDLARALKSHGIVVRDEQADFVGTGETRLAHVKLSTVVVDEPVIIEKETTTIGRRGRSSSLDALAAGLKNALAGPTGDATELAEFGADIFQQQVPFVFAGEAGSRETFVCLTGSQRRC